MKLILKRYLIRIPDGIDIFYCEKKQLLVVKKKLYKKIIKLKVKLIVLKDKKIIIITNSLFNKTSNKWKNLNKSFQGSTVMSIKQALIDVNIATCQKLKLVGVGYKVFELQLKQNGFVTNFLHFKLGYSHSVYCKIPKELIVKTYQSTQLFIFGNSFPC